MPDINLKNKDPKFKIQTVYPPFGIDDPRSRLSKVEQNILHKIEEIREEARLSKSQDDYYNALSSSPSLNGIAETEISVPLADNFFSAKNINARLEGSSRAALETLPKSTNAIKSTLETIAEKTNAIIRDTLIIPTQETTNTHKSTQKKQAVLASIPTTTTPQDLEPPVKTTQNTSEEKSTNGVVPPPPTFKDAWTRSVNLGWNFGTSVAALYTYNTLTAEMANSGNKFVTFGGAYKGVFEKSIEWGNGQKKTAIVLSILAAGYHIYKSYYLAQLASKKDGDAKKTAYIEQGSSHAAALSSFAIIPALKKLTGKYPRSSIFIAAYALTAAVAGGTYFGLRKSFTDTPNDKLKKETINASILGSLTGAAALVVNWDLLKQAKSMLNKLKDTGEPTIKFLGKPFTATMLTKEIRWAGVGMALMAGAAILKIMVSKNRSLEKSDSPSAYHSFLSATAGFVTSMLAFGGCVIHQAGKATKNYYEQGKINTWLTKVAPKLAPLHRAGASNFILRGMFIGGIASLAVGLVTDYYTRKFLYWKTDKDSHKINLPIA